MLKVQEIREIIKLVDQSSLDEFVYEHEGSKIQMKKGVLSTVTAVQPATKAVETIQVSVPTPVAAPVEQTQVVVQASQAVKPEAEAANLHKIVSPMVGTFYAAPSPEADAYVKPGSKISKDSIVCIVEAMKLFNEIEAEVNGEIVEVLVKNGQLVEFGQPLFLVKSE
ncbi:MAG TPA: acetyl-CoA carboxylase biotin carboxyl carrier protein [Bacillales bacterium]|nr:acetyl-CoA carboxylase biotin carboxyl carrier protein [Bacillales bacterium]